MNDRAGIPPISAEEVSKLLIEAVECSYKAGSMQEEATQAERVAVEAWNEYYEMQERLFGEMDRNVAFDKSKFGLSRPKAMVSDGYK